MLGFVLISGVKAGADDHQRDGWRKDGGLLLQSVLFNGCLPTMSTVTHVMFMSDRHQSQTHFDEQKNAEAAPASELYSNEKYT